MPVAVAIIIANMGTHGYGHGHITLSDDPTPLFKQHMTKWMNQYNFHKVQLTGSASLTTALLLG